MSETVCDEANRTFLQAPLAVPDHRLEAQAQSMDDLDRSLTPRPKPLDNAQADLALAKLVAGKPDRTQPEERAPPSNCALKRPLGTTDVFVDDFIQLGQGGRKRLRSRALGRRNVSSEQGAK